MSNYLAVATVTAALAQIVQTSAQRAVGGATVAIGRPGTTGNGGNLHQVHLYLYQVSPNAALRNADLPTRNSQGQLSQRPQVALDLHYLLSFHGEEKSLEPERMLGAIVRDLHAHPRLTRRDIHEAINNTSELGDSDLADAIESVKFTPVALSLDELSKLWSVFVQTPHALSVVYQGTVVLIEAEEEPTAVRLVRSPGIYGTPLKIPFIERVKAKETVGSAAQQVELSYPGNFVWLTNTLLVEGRHLKGNDTLVLIDGEDTALSDVQISDQRISFPLASLKLRTGAHALQIVHRMQLGAGGMHKIVQSNVVAFVLCPIINLPAKAAERLAVSFQPAIGRTQRVKLLLYERPDPENAAPQFYVIEAPPDNGLTEENHKETKVITFPLNTVTAGKYLIRAQVDGIESNQVGFEVTKA